MSEQQDDATNTYHVTIGNSLTSKKSYYGHSLTEAIDKAMSEYKE